MKSLGRDSRGTKQQNHEQRILSLERRVFPQIQYASVPLDVASSSGLDTTFVPTDPLNGTWDDLFPSENTRDWRLIDGEIHVPNLGAGQGGGFFQTFAECTFDNADPIGTDVGTASTRIKVRMDIYDEDEVQIDTDFQAIWRQRAVQRMNARYYYTESALFYNQIPFSQPELGGWHAHFHTEFFNATVTPDQIGGLSLTVMRLGPALAQFEGQAL